jgi:hypothetical protein
MQSYISFSGVIFRAMNVLCIEAKKLVFYDV